MCETITQCLVHIKILADTCGSGSKACIARGGFKASRTLAQQHALNRGSHSCDLVHR